MAADNGMGLTPKSHFFMYFLFHDDLKRYKKQWQVGIALLLHNLIQKLLKKIYLLVTVATPLCNQFLCLAV